MDPSQPRLSNTRVGFPQSVYPFPQLESTADASSQSESIETAEGSHDCLDFTVRIGNVLMESTYKSVVLKADAHSELLPPALFLTRCAETVAVNKTVVLGLVVKTTTVCRADLEAEYSRFRHLLLDLGNVDMFGHVTLLRVVCATSYTMDLKEAFASFLDDDGSSGAVLLDLSTRHKHDAFFGFRHEFDRRKASSASSGRSEREQWLCGACIDCSVGVVLLYDVLIMKLVTRVDEIINICLVDFLVESQRYVFHYSNRELEA